MVKSTLHLVITAYCGQINPWTLCRQAHVYKHHVHNYETYMRTVSVYITLAICISYSYITVGVGYLLLYKDEAKLRTSVNNKVILELL